ncbi:MAG: transposase, partial [Deltaproteobacteria bacterium]|nr:transposase [Deltaproteobacteria bacterium]
MKKIPYGRYTPELREEAVKLVTEGGMSVGEVSRRLSLPKSTLENLSITDLGFFEYAERHAAEDT